ncbi:FxLYD domain-containing protein [Streptomyces sp. EN23]|uniref:FxLYD domain-containing protein n=1 Tax=Streptomyces sp. EN23 TaxID=212774 RepID=UPI000851D8EC|nr:FxLYD domain-containing protein [Streptomyces sp. EN23]
MSQQYPQGQQPQGWGQQQPGWGGQQPPAPKKSNAGKAIGFGCLGVVGLLVVIGVVGAVASGGDDGGKGASSKASAVSEPAAGAPEKEPAEEPKEEAPAKAKEPSGPEGDVKITKCEVDGMTQWPSASLDVTNRSSKASNYIISVEFVDKDGTRLGEGTAALNNLAPDQVSKEKAQGLTQVSGKISCKVTKVTRYAS